MAGTQLIEHEGRKVLLISMAYCDQVKALAVMKEATKLIEGHPPKSLITITQVEGMHYTPANVRAITDYAAHNEPWVTVGIVVGVSGVRKAIFNSLVKLTGRRLYAFERMDQAREWLQKHARDTTKIAGSAV